MNGLLLVAGREVTLRFKLLPVALALGFTPLALAPVVGLESTFLAILFAQVFGLSTALLLGATVIAGELGSGRLGFFFARPLAWWDIWGGKLLSSFLLSVGAAILVAVPTVVIRRLNPLDHLDGMAIPFMASATLLVLGAAHAAGVAWRSRSGVLLADLTLLLAATFVLRGAWPRLARAGFVPTPFPLWAIVLLVAGMAALFLAAGAAQVSLARTDLRRGHQVLSLAFWVPFFAALAVVELAGRWALNPALGDLVRAEIAYAAPAGNWVAVMGPVRGRGPSYWPTFLVETATGRSLKVDPQGFVAFTADGTRAAWLEADSGFETGDVRLSTADLAKAVSSSTALAAFEPSPPGWMYSLAFSPEKDRLLVAAPGWLAVYAVETGKRLAHVPAQPGAAFGVAFFDGPQTIRALRSRPGAVPWEPRIREIVAIGLPEGTVRVTGRIESPGGVRFDGGGRRLIVMRDNARVGALCDGRSGERIADLTPKPDAFAMDAGFLGDGRVALAEAGPSGAQVRLFNPEGHELALVPLGRARSVRVGGEPLPGRLAVGLEAAPFGPSDLALVDTEAARVVRVEKGLAPPRLQWFQGDPVTRGGAGSPGASAFLDEDGGVVRLDHESGERRMILPGTPRGGPYP